MHLPQIAPEGHDSTNFQRLVDLCGCMRKVSPTSKRFGKSAAARFNPAGHHPGELTGYATLRG